MANPPISEEVRKTGIGQQMRGDLEVTKAYLPHKTVIAFCDLVVLEVRRLTCPGWFRNVDNSPNRRYPFGLPSFERG
jgi:hypothetical protein